MTPLEELQHEADKEETTRRQLFRLRQIKALREVRNGKQKTI
jgi:hypothetical protein